MPFPRARSSTPAARPRVRVDVFAVGRRVFVADRGGGADRVPRPDGAERRRAALADGAEVTIVAWRPGGAGTTRCSVRVTDSGLEGWLLAGDLRSTRIAIPSAPAVSPPPAARPGPLGASESPTSARRF